MAISVREFAREDIRWIKEELQLELKMTLRGREIVGVAMADYKKVGLGRIIVVDETSCEIDYLKVAKGNHKRTKNIIRMLIKYLLGKAERPFIYTHPHKRGLSVYKEFGFSKIDGSHPAIPDSIKSKELKDQEADFLMVKTDSFVNPPKREDIES